MSEREEILERNKLLKEILIHTPIEMFDEFLDSLTNLKFAQKEVVRLKEILKTSIYRFKLKDLLSFYPKDHLIKDSIEDVVLELVNQAYSEVLKEAAETEKEKDTEKLKRFEDLDMKEWEFVVCHIHELFYYKRLSDNDIRIKIMELGYDIKDKYIQSLLETDDVLDFADTARSMKN